MADRSGGNTGESKKKGTTRAETSPVEAYLLLYNSACAVGWNFAMFKISGAFMEGGGIRQAVEASHDVIVVLQLLSTLEFVHACIGLVSCQRLCPSPIPS